ncbi:BrnT family toxin [Candidatus Gottesmanbacteria bacterium]|nr:BrnT family toxin [Candidatus Gottesmanbacteria bacterium]
MEFEWDIGNSSKSLKKHRVTDQEAEEAFFDQYKVQFTDAIHSQSEERFILIGRSNSKKILYIAYTIRKNKVRIISARILNKKEQYLYEKGT